MVASGTLPDDNKILSFTMAHKMALVVVDFPKTVYKFSDTSIPDYYIPTEVAWNDITPYYNPSDGAYRHIVNPTTTSSLSISGTFNAGGNAFAFTATENVSGSYNLYAIDGATVTTTETTGVEVLDGELNITTDDVIGITGSGSGRIIINGSPTVILYNYTNTIDVNASSITVNGGTPTIILAGTNTFNRDNNYILHGQVISLCNGAGVIIDGQGDGTMIINSERTDGDDALIGSAAGDTAGDIVIKNTSLTLNMDYYNYAPIIGAGNGDGFGDSKESSCGNITIENSTLKFSMSYNLAPFIGAGKATAYKNEIFSFLEDENDVDNISSKSICGDINISNTIVNINLSSHSGKSFIGTGNANSNIMGNASGIAEALSKCGDVNMTNSSINVQATYGYDTVIGCGYASANVDHGATGTATATTEIGTITWKDAAGNVLETIEAVKNTKTTTDE